MSYVREPCFDCDLVGFTADENGRLAIPCDACEGLGMLFIEVPPESGMRLRSEERVE